MRSAVDMANSFANDAGRDVQPANPSGHRFNYLPFQVVRDVGDLARNERVPTLQGRSVSARVIPAFRPFKVWAYGKGS